jgi:hypothetical protein
MPVLPNPRHEAFAQALFAGLSRSENYSQGKAYLEAGYKASPESARRCASRLLTFVDGVAERVHELQAQQLDRIKPKLDLSKERIGRRLNLASEIAEQERNAQGILASELGIAKVFHLLDADPAKPQDWNSVQSTHEMGRKLLQSIGFDSPDDVSIQAAIEANDAFIERLEAIRNEAQGLTIDQDD